jgi:hypothetical protein
MSYDGGGGVKCRRKITQDGIWGGAFKQMFIIGHINDRSIVPQSEWSIDV